MKYTYLNALVPEGEHFDESAIVNEGGWVSTAHLDAVEAALAGSVANIQKITSLNEQLATAKEFETELDAAQETIAEKDKTIGEMQAKLDAYGEKPSGSGSQLPAADEVAEDAKGDGKTYKINDPEHPANRFAESIKKQYKGFKK